MAESPVPCSFFQFLPPIGATGDSLHCACTGWCPGAPPYPFGPRAGRPLRQTIASTNSVAKLGVSWGCSRWKLGPFGGPGRTERRCHGRGPHLSVGTSLRGSATPMSPPSAGAGAAGGGRPTAWSGGGSGWPVWRGSAMPAVPEHREMLRGLPVVKKGKGGGLGAKPLSLGIVLFGVSLFERSARAFLQNARARVWPPRLDASQGLAWAAPVRMWAARVRSRFPI